MIQQRILIVEDDHGIADYMARGLEGAGYATDVVDDGLDAYDKAIHNPYDMIVLDLGLPTLDGLEVLRRIRAKGVNVPVIVLSARTSVVDRVGSLEGGANDYMPKPFQFAELLVRVRLRLGDGQPADPTTQLRHGALTLDLRTQAVQVDGTWMDLTRRELGLLENFLRHPGEVLSRTDLLKEVWGLDFDPNSNVVDVYVRSLRRKIGEGYVETVRGRGYRLK